MFFNCFNEVTIKNLTVNIQRDSTYFYRNSVSLIHSTKPGDGCKLLLENVTMNGDEPCFQSEYAPFISKLYSANDQITFKNCVNNVDVYNTYSYSSAFVGSFDHVKSIEFIDCVNNGTIACSDKDEGLPSILIGNIGGNLSDTSITITNFTNNGKIMSFKDESAVNAVNSQKWTGTEATFNGKYEKFENGTEVAFDSTKTYSSLFGSSYDSSTTKVTYSMGGHLNVYNKLTSQNVNKTYSVFDMAPETVDDSPDLKLLNISVNEDDSSNTKVFTREKHDDAPLKTLEYSSTDQYYFTIPDHDNLTYQPVEDSCVTMFLYLVDSSTYEVKETKLVEFPAYNATDKTKCLVYTIK